MSNTSIDERLEEAAKYGQMDIYLYLWEKTIQRLQKSELVVNKKYPSKRKGEFYCNISWAEATVANGSQASYLYKMAVEGKN